MWNMLLRVMVIVAVVATIDHFYGPSINAFLRTHGW